MKKEQSKYLLKYKFYPLKELSNEIEKIVHKKPYPHPKGLMLTFSRCVNINDFLYLQDKLIKAGYEIHIGFGDINSMRYRIIIPLEEIELGNKSEFRKNLKIKYYD